MITLETFALAIQSGLNSNGEIAFRIFVDAAEYAKAKKTRTAKTRYTNGLLRVGTSSVIPSQGGVIATQSAQLEIVVALPSPETDEAIIKAHRAVLDTYFQNYSTQLITENGKSYSVAAVYSLADTGTVETRDGIGTSLTFYINVKYSYVENGITSDDCVFILDGHAIPYTTASMGKSPSTEVNTYADGDGKSGALNTGFVRRFSFDMPALLNNDASNAIISALCGSELNAVHALQVEVKDVITASYNVIIGEVEMNMRGIDNPGIKFSLTEAASLAEVSNG